MDEFQRLRWQVRALFIGIAALILLVPLIDWLLL
jgi:hypothetical protein